MMAANESGWSFMAHRPELGRRSTVEVVSSQPRVLSTAPEVSSGFHRRLVATRWIGILSDLASLLPSVKKPSRTNAFTVAGDVCWNIVKISALCVVSRPSLENIIFATDSYELSMKSRNIFFR